MIELAELLERCLRGDALAWEAFVRLHQGRVYGLALHYVRHTEEARDVAQEIFVRLYRKLHTYRPDQSFLAWMLAVGRNVCLDHLRRAKARPPAADMPAELAPLADPGPGPEEAADRASARHLLRRGLERLNPSHREMILLCEIQDLPLEEIARMLGIPLGTVKSRASRARVELAREVLALRTQA